MKIKIVSITGVSSNAENCSCNFSLLQSKVAIPWLNKRNEMLLHIGWRVLGGNCL